MNLRAIAMSTLLSAATLAAVAQAETAQGIVYLDRNANGQHDSGEPGLPGVAVSNQRDVVLTDDAGRYRLPVDDDTIIFVNQPAGYRAPLNKHNLPQFYYIHKPAGSPELRYRGVDPTGPLPESIDFPLREAPNADRFDVLALGDPQPETGTEIGYVRDDVASELVGTDAAFAITLGDIMFDALWLYDYYNGVMAKVGIPFFNVIGNHDMNYDAADDTNSDETFHRHFGPNYYAWDHGQVHFMALDTVEWKGAEHGGHYRGYLGERQLAWIKDDLAHVPADKLIVLCMHIPLATAFERGVDDVEALFEILRDRPKVLALSGHTHYLQHHFYGPEEGWQGQGKFHSLICGAVCGSWWSGPKDFRGIPIATMSDGTPNGYVTLSFDGTDYTTRYKAAGASPDEQMWIYPPGLLGRSAEDRKTLLVNVWNARPLCTVEYAFDHGEFHPMERFTGLDPIAQSILAGPLKSGKSWANPEKTTHLWKATLDARLPGGTHVVTIRVTDPDGRVLEQSRVF